MAISRRIDEGTTGHAFRRGGERGVRRDRLEAMWIAGRVGRVEMVPDRDPVESELLDSYVIVAMRAPFDRDGLERFAADVIPAVSA